MAVAYDVSTGVERLILAVVLAGIGGPDLEQDRRVGPGGAAAGNGGNLVALMSRDYLSDVLDELLLEVALRRGIWWKPLSALVSTGGWAAGVSDSSAVSAGLERTIGEGNVECHLPSIVGDGQSDRPLGYGVTWVSVFYG